MDVPSPASGTITKIFVAEGDTVLMGSVIAEMELVSEQSEDVSESTDQGAPWERQSPPASRIGTLVQGANVGPTGGEFLDASLTSSEPKLTSARRAKTPISTPREKEFSPLVVRLAAQHDIDLNTLVGTGLEGRVTKKDVLNAVKPVAEDADGNISVDDDVVDPTPIRRMIAERMTKSTSEIPHAWSAIEVDVSGLVQWREEKKLRFEEVNGFRLTYLPITLSTVARALRSHPRINSSWVDGKIVLKRAINVGVAVASADGLLVPVIHDAADASVFEVARKLNGLLDQVRRGKMTLENAEGGTFTLNNTGTLGSIWGGAIINYPQAAILTTETITKRPIVVVDGGTDSIVVRSMMNICLSFDHRIIDGAEASEFMQSVKTGLESIDGSFDAGDME
jgi:2-oxoisovalerate dehydrogenase E2 component (dihydrolipoyl transacylase)